MAVLNFTKLDKQIVEEYCKENSGILKKTAIKEQSLYKPENWWYFYVFLEEDQEFKKYIRDTLKEMASRSLSLAALYLLTSEKGSPEEKAAMRIILAKLNVMKSKPRAQALVSLYACSELGRRLQKI